MTKTTKMTFVLILAMFAFGAVAHLGRANQADASLEALFGPAIGDPEPVDEVEFPTVDVTAPFTPEELGVSPEEMKAPVYRPAAALRAATTPIAGLAGEVVKNDGGFCRGVARIEDNTRDAELRQYIEEVLDAATPKIKDPGNLIRECVVRANEAASIVSKLACIDLDPTPEAQTATTLIEDYKARLTRAVALCVGISPVVNGKVLTISDKQIRDAYGELLREE